MSFLTRPPCGSHLFTGTCFLVLTVAVTAEWTINAPNQPLNSGDVRFPDFETCLPDLGTLSVVTLASIESPRNKSANNCHANSDVSQCETDLLISDLDSRFDSPLFQRIEFATGCFVSEIHESLDSLTSQRPGKSHTVLLLALPAKTRENILLRGTAPIMSPSQLTRASNLIHGYEHHYADLLRRRNLILERNHGLTGIHELILFNDLAIFLVNREIKSTIFKSILNESQRTAAIENWNHRSGYPIQ